MNHFNIDEGSYEDAASSVGHPNNILSNVSVSNVDMISPKGAQQLNASFGIDSYWKRYGLRETTQNKLSLQYNERNLVKLIEFEN